MKGITFGGFEYVHIGHINLFERARSMCDFLYVMVSSDEFIRDRKGHLPEFGWRDRARAVEGIKYVDVVGIQSAEFGKKDAIKCCEPDLIFVGSDWKGKGYDGENLGVQVIYLPRTDNISSTKIRNAKNG